MHIPYGIIQKLLLFKKKKMRRTKFSHLKKEKLETI